MSVAEADIHPDYLNAIIKSEAQDTVYTEAYSTNWPNAPHRVLQSCVDAAQAFEEGDIVGTVADTWNGETYESQRFQPHLIHKSAKGNIAAMPHWAGEGIGDVKQVQTAAEIIQEIVSEAESLLRRW